MLATGDRVQAQSLEEEGTPTRTLQGLLEILVVPAWDYYPASTYYFVEGQEADENTITAEPESHTVAASPIEAFHYCNQHDCSTHGSWAHGDVEEHGMDGWPPARREAVLKTVSKLQTKYGVSAEVDATPTKKGWTNQAEVKECVAAVDPRRPGYIFLNPKMADDQWLKATLSTKMIVSKSVADVITHEYGHILEGELEKRRDFKTLSELHRPYTDAIGDDQPFDRNRLRIEVSYYAGEDTHEAIAESFLSWEKGRRDNDWINHVGQIYTKVFIDQREEANGT